MKVQKFISKIQFIGHTYRYKLLLIVETVNMFKVTSTCPQTKSLFSLLRLRVRLGTIVAQLAADGEVSPEGTSQVMHPFVSCLGP